MITIASGGCNVLNYLAANPERIIAVDLNPNHVALTRLKLSALANLPSYEDFFRFFGTANSKANRKAFDNFLSTRLDPVTRRYWEKQIPLHGRRINMFARNLYSYGLLGRFIGVLHAVARLHGKKLNDIVEARTPAEQRRAFEKTIAPLFEYKSIKLLSKSPVSLYALGIPPAQYDELVARPPTAIRLPSCVSAWKSSPAISPSTKTISPGRLSRADTTSRTARRFRPICSPILTT